MQKKCKLYGTEDNTFEVVHTMVSLQPSREEATTKWYCRGSIKYR